MPLVQWACPEGKNTYGETHDPKYCITECADKCASPFLIAALTSSVRTNHHKGKYISATGLSGCNRKLYLERTLDYADYMKNSFYSYRGTVMHQVVEDAGNMEFEGIPLGHLGYLTEWRMLIGFCFKHGGFSLEDHPTIDPTDSNTWGDIVCPSCRKSRIRLSDREVILLGGTLDGLEPVWSEFQDGILPCILWDLKTMQEYAVNYFIKGDPKNTYHRHVKDEHYMQAQVYKYLVERSRPPDLLWERGVRKLRLVESNIQAFSMGQFPRTGSTYRWKDHYTKPETDWEIPAVTFMTDEEIEEYIRVAARPIFESLVMGREIPPICKPNSNKATEHSWECRFCAFQNSKYCPDPAKEWDALQQGMSPEGAFQHSKE